MTITRQTSIDYMKSALTIGMILAHSLQLLSVLKGVYYFISLFVNLITFSGFVFCFGYVCYISYFAKEYVDVKYKILKTAGKTLVGYYVSGIASLLLLNPVFNHRSYVYNSIWKFFLLIDIPWYSEFLLAFFLFTIFSLLLFRFFKHLMFNSLALLTLIGICVVVTILIPSDFIISAPLALLVGTKDQGTFPIIQYLPFFIAGVYFSSNKVVLNRWIFVLCILGSVSFVSYYLYRHESPSRFPPSIYWMVGSIGVLYIYFLISKWIEYKEVNISFLLSIGRNSLFYLIVSNIMLFSLSNVLKTSPLIALCIAMIVIIAISFLIDLVIPTQSQPK